MAAVTKAAMAIGVLVTRIANSAIFVKMESAAVNSELKAIASKSMMACNVELRANGLASGQQTTSRTSPSPA